MPHSCGLHVAGISRAPRDDSITATVIGSFADCDVMPSAGA